MGSQRVRHNWETHTFTSLLFVLGIQLISVKGTIYMSIPKETVLLRILFKFQPVCLKHLYSQSYGFSRNHIWMWELDHKEGWIPKNWCFWTVVLEKTLESPLDSKEIKPVNPKEINSEYSLEGLVLKLKLQYFGYLMWRADSLEKALMLGKIEGKRRSGQQRMR